MHKALKESSINLSYDEPILNCKDEKIFFFFSLNLEGKKTLENR